ncbi:MAG: pilus assembly protein TadG-related protein [Acidimicrobiales bacterium]
MNPDLADETAHRAPSLPPHRGGDDSERGYVMVMLSLSMVLLLAFAGYSVDLGNWNLQRNEVRTVAEAAALGGVAFLPDDFATAKVTAEALAEAQGFDRSEVTVALGSAPNRLRVTVTREVENYFVRVIGMNTRTISETAEAEFEQPVDMGSPTIVLGNDPESGANPGYWLSVAGQGVDKALGDQFATRNCTVGTDGCSGTSNDEWAPAGYQYTVRVVDTTQPLRIQVFDPAWVWTGSACNVPDFPTPAEIAALVASSGSHAQIPAGYYDDAATRYAAGPGDFCTGDDLPGATGPATTFTVRLPDNSPWDDTDNPTIPAASCSPKTFPAYEPASIYSPPTESIFDLLTEGGDNEWRIQDNGTFTFAEVFRRWVTICELSPGPWLRTGDYIVQVSTDNGEGQNRYSLRAGPPVGDGIGDNGQAIFSRQRLPIFVNTPDADTSFFLVRVPPSSDRRLLRLSFFDIGDAAAPGTLTVVPPADTALGVFRDCSYTLGGSPMTSSNCSLSGVWDDNGYGGKTVEATVEIPAIDDPTDPYVCDETDENACWVTVRMQFAGGITDATTWTAELIGDSVRIIPE